MDHVTPSVVCGRGSTRSPVEGDSRSKFYGRLSTEQAQAQVSLSQGVAVGDTTTGSTTGHSDCIISGRAGC